MINPDRFKPAFAIAMMVLLGMAVAMPGSRAAFAGEEPEPNKKQADNGKEDGKEKKDEKKKTKKPKEDRFFALKRGVVHLAVTTLHGVTILSKNGTIVEIGPDVVVPEKAERLDASGYHVYPGPVAVASAGPLGAEPPDDSTNVFSLHMKIALAGGITTAVGGNTAAKMSYGTTDEMIVKRDLFKTLKYSTIEPNERRKLRAKFEKVRQYMRDLEAHEEAKKTDPDAEEPDGEWVKGEFETCLKLLRHEVVAVMSAGTTHEIAAAVELAERYGIDIVLRGAHEAWTMAPRMARAGLSAIITPRRNVFRDERLNRPTGTSIENANVLYEHGVPFAIVPPISAIMLWGLAGRDLLHLNMEAAFAVRGGLPENAAVRAITIDAARIAGIDHRVGSIEVGKDADFVVTDGELLHYMTHPRWTVVNGRIVYDKQAD